MEFKKFDHKNSLWNFKKILRNSYGILRNLMIKDFKVRSMASEAEFFQK